MNKFLIKIFALMAVLMIIGIAGCSSVPPKEINITEPPKTLGETGVNKTQTTAPNPESTTKPTSVPTTKPTSVPTTKPTSVPTTKPTSVPTTEPTPVPTTEPTPVPTTEPTAFTVTAHSSTLNVVPYHVMGQSIDNTASISKVSILTEVLGGYYTLTISGTYTANIISTNSSVLGARVSIYDSTGAVVKSIVLFMDDSFINNEQYSFVKIITLPGPGNYTYRIHEVK